MIRINKFKTPEALVEFLNTNNLANNIISINRDVTRGEWYLFYRED